MEVVEDEEKEQFGPPEESSALVMMADASPLMQQQPEAEEVAADGEMLSPDGRRRSTRASALRAQERLRDGEPLKQNQSEQPANSPNEKDDEEKSLAETEEEKPKKRKRLAAEADLDPRDPHFAIKKNSDGEDSEFSSLNEEDIQHIRKNYMKVMSQELTEEQRMERQRMIRQLQAELGLEEAKLLMLKKLRMSQQMPRREVNRNTGAVGNTMSPQMRTQISTGAYRPPVATAPNQPLKTAAPKMNSNQKRPLAPAHQAKAQIPPHLSTGHCRGQTAHGSSGFRRDVQVGFREQLEKTLLQIPPPRPPPSEMHLVPSHNQPDFLCLVGLDLVVSRHKKSQSWGDPMQEPYVCTQCGTDFTPSWKAVPRGKDGDELKVMCEQCVRQNQKKALKAQHTNRLKQAFARALQQEQDIQQQFSGSVASVAPVSRGSSSQVSSTSVRPAAVNLVDTPTQAAMLRALSNAMAAAAGAGLPFHNPFLNLMIPGRFPSPIASSLSANSLGRFPWPPPPGGMSPPAPRALNQRRPAGSLGLPKTSSFLPWK